MFREKSRVAPLFFNPTMNCMTLTLSGAYQERDPEPTSTVRSNVFSRSGLCFESHRGSPFSICVAHALQ